MGFVALDAIYRCQLTGELQTFLLAQPPKPKGSYPKGREGRMILFRESTGWNLGHTVYDVYSRRGGMYLGKIEWRNQWQAWSVILPERCPINKEILTEFYAMLKELGA